MVLLYVSNMDFTILAVVLLIGVGIPVRNKIIRKYREEKKKKDLETIAKKYNKLDQFNDIMTKLEKLLK